MGLLDILNGMQNGPGGAREPQPQQPSGSSGGMPTWMMALLGLLAYKAVKGGGLENMMGGGRHAVPDPGTAAGQSGGGLGDILGGMLGGGARPGASGGGLGDILGNALGGGARPGATAPGGGLGDILGGMLGGGNARAGAGAPGGGLSDILGGLLGGGAAGSVLNGGLKNLLGDMEENGQSEAVKSWVGTGQNRPISQTDLASAVGIDDIDAVARQTGMPREQLLSELSQHLPEFVNQLTPDGRLPTHEESSRW